MAEEFYTFREYMNADRNLLSACEEDYIEMIYRLCHANNGYTRVNDIANALNVKSPSVTKMIKKLGEKGLIAYRKYGIIEMQSKGKSAGELLLNRHDTVEKFLKLLNIEEGLLEETEKIEHTVNSRTLLELKRLVDFFDSNPELMEAFSIYRNTVNRNNM